MFLNDIIQFGGWHCGEINAGPEPVAGSMVKVRLIGAEFVKNKYKCKKTHRSI